MATAPPYTLTNESVTVIWEGQSHTVQKGHPNYVALRRAIVDERWDDIVKNLTVRKSLQEWAKGKFTLAGDQFMYAGDKLPNSLNTRMVRMASGGEDPTPLMRFWERLQKNPSFRSVEQLYEFLQHEGIPFTKDGCFLAYKSVRPNLTDHHSGTVDNKPGVVNEMPRNKISDDPKVECDYGFHVGALAYVESFGGRDRKIVICKVDPADVVCVPYDNSQHKMRVCKYKVLGYHNGQQMPSTFLDTEDSPNEIDVDQPADQESSEHQVDLEGIISADQVAENEEEIPGEKSRTGEPEKRKSKKGYAKFDKLDMEGLMKEPIMDLREYASKGLQIVGASKIQGGKTALVARIMEVREG